MRIAISVTVLLLLLLVAAPAEERPSSLLQNGSFEALVPAKPVKDSGAGAWTFGEDRRVPSGWTLNSAYPGRMTVLDEGAANGKHCIEITAGARRDAQIYKPCPALRPGAWYRVTFKVRGGSATVLAYEYDQKGAVKAHSLASGSEEKDAFEEVIGFYSPATEGFRNASVALLVPRGTTAVLDDLVVEEMPGAAARAEKRTIRLENKAVTMVISGHGRLESLVSKVTKEDYAHPGAPMPVLTAVRDGVRIPVVGLMKNGSTLTARFADPAVTAKLKVTSKDRYFAFEVTDVTPKDLEALELRFPVRLLGVNDGWMPGTYNKEFGITHMPVTPNTLSVAGRYGTSVAPETRWFPRYGIKGGKSVLIATTFEQFFDTIQKMERDTGLPSPRLHSGAPGGTGTTDWARLSPAVRKSYLFATYMGANDVDALIRYAKIGGFGLIMLHRATWRASAGHEEIATKAFPNGLPDLVAACEKIRAAGLGVGLHLFGPHVSENDAYVTPVPDPRLFTIPVGPLAEKLDAAATELALKAEPDLPRIASLGVYPGNLLRIGDEIVRWQKMVPGKPCRLIGLTRGALGTKATAHRAREEVRSFTLGYGRFLVDPDSSLPEEMGRHLARVVNATRADLVYFDAIGAAPKGKEPERWYYVNKTLLASCAGFKHGVMVQTGLGPGRQLPWHLVPRSASADGHGDLKGYLDQRLAGVLQIRRTFTAADIGWYALDVHGKPDELEYVCAKALATDANVSVQATRQLLESHPRAREVFEMIARWERRRLTDDVPEATKKILLTKKRDFKLLAEPDDGWSIYEAAYEVERQILALDGQANRFEGVNPRKEPVRLSLEIVRETISTTPQRHAGPDSIEVVDLRDITTFGDSSDAGLLGHARIGDRIINAEGLSLRGVDARFTALANAPGGRKAALLKADNTTNGAGWCTTGKRLPEPLDLSGAKALGFWVKGDGHGESVALLLADSSGRRVRFSVTLDFKGWRFKSFPLRGTFAWSNVEYVLFELSHIAPHAKVSAGIADVRAVPALHQPISTPGLRITLGDRTVLLPVTIEPNRSVTIDPLGRGTIWPGGMAEGQGFDLEGGALILPPGTTPLTITLPQPDGYAGDLSVRPCRAWPQGSGLTLR